MSDQELLEMAAKAAGMGGSPPSNFFLEHWQPLTDDGDALRLAVAIRACIVVDNEMKWCGVHLQGERGKYEFVEHFGNDSAAATRRAIVRAAAEIGKGMP